MHTVPFTGSRNAPRPTTAPQYMVDALGNVTSRMPQCPFGHTAGSILDELNFLSTPARLRYECWVKGSTFAGEYATARGAIVMGSSGSGMQPVQPT